MRHFCTKNSKYYSSARASFQKDNDSFYSIYLFLRQLVTKILAMLLKLSIISLALFRSGFCSHPYSLIPEGTDPYFGTQNRES
jgi:hypothetical protein